MFLTCFWLHLPGCINWNLTDLSPDTRLHPFYPFSSPSLCTWFLISYAFINVFSVIPPTQTTDYDVFCKHHGPRSLLSDLICQPVRHHGDQRCLHIRAAGKYGANHTDNNNSGQWCPTTVTQTYQSTLLCVVLAVSRLAQANTHTCSWHTSQQSQAQIACDYLSWAEHLRHFSNELARLHSSCRWCPLGNTLTPDWRRGGCKSHTHTESHQLHTLHAFIYILHLHFIRYSKCRVIRRCPDIIVQYLQ